MADDVVVVFGKKEIPEKKQSQKLEKTRKETRASDGEWRTMAEGHPDLKKFLSLGQFFIFIRRFCPYYSLPFTILEEPLAHK